MENMTLGDFAKAYTPNTKVTKNIADLSKVSTKLKLFEKEGIKKDGSKFKYLATEIDGQEYRVPKKVIEQLQTILKFAPNLEHFKVTKTGTTKDDTQYKVEPFI